MTGAVGTVSAELHPGGCNALCHEDLHAFLVYTAAGVTAAEVREMMEYHTARYEWAGVVDVRLAEAPVPEGLPAGYVEIGKLPIGVTRIAWLVTATTGGRQLA